MAICREPGRELIRRKTDSKSLRETEIVHFVPTEVLTHITETDTKKKLKHKFAKATTNCRSTNHTAFGSPKRA